MGEVRQLFTVVMSVVSVVQVDWSHFAVSNLGRVVEAEYAVVHVLVVGSVIQAIMFRNDLGRVVEALYVPVQPVAV